MAGREEPETIDSTLMITVSLRDLALVIDNFGYDYPTDDSVDAMERLFRVLQRERNHRG